MGGELQIRAGGWCVEFPHRTQTPSQGWLNKVKNAVFDFMSRGLASRNGRRPEMSIVPQAQEKIYTPTSKAGLFLAKKPSFRSAPLEGGLSPKGEYFKTKSLFLKCLSC